MIPGETISQKIKITNESQENVEMFLWAENNNEKTDEEKENLVKEFLAKYSQLTVKDDKGKLLYKGGMASEGDSERLSINLGNFLPKEEKTLFLTLQVLPDAGNEFSMFKANVDWGIKAGAVETKIPDTSDRNYDTIVALAVFVLADMVVILFVFFIKRRKTFMKKQK
jgi:hypothetical protein